MLLIFLTINDNVKLDLKKGEFKPFMKPSDYPVYIDKQSNHSPTHTFSKTSPPVYVLL